MLTDLRHTLGSAVALSTLAASTYGTAIAGFYASTPSTQAMLSLQPYAFDDLGSTFPEINQPKTVVFSYDWFVRSARPSGNFLEPGSNLTIPDLWHDYLRFLTYGCLFVWSHTGQSGIPIEHFSSLSEAVTRRAQLQGFPDFFGDEIVLFQADADPVAGIPAHWSVGLDFALGLGSWTTFSENAIAYIAGCKNTTYDWADAGASAWFDYEVAVDTHQAGEDLFAVWWGHFWGLHLDGHDDNKWIRSAEGAHWALEFYDRPHTDLRFGGPNTRITLAPTVSWHNLDLWLDPDFVESRFIAMDTAVDTPSGSLHNVVTAEWPLDVDYFGTYWTDPGYLNLLLVPRTTGIANLTLHGSEVRSASHLGTVLDGNPDNSVPNDNGNNGGLGEDWVYPVVIDDNTSGEIPSFVVVDGIARWVVEGSDEGVESYAIEEADDPDGPWSALLSNISPGSGTYSVTVPSTTSSLVRLVSADSTSVRSYHGISRFYTTASLPPAAGGAGYGPSESELVAHLNSLAVERGNEPYSYRQEVGIGETYVAYVPATFRTEVDDYVAGFWEWWGYETVVVEIDSLPGFSEGDQELLRQSIHDDIRTRAGAGSKYFHLIGDSNDWAEMADLSLWPPPYWSVVHNDMISQEIIHPAGQPHLDIIPSYSIPDTAPRGQNLAWTRPYWFSDQLFADTGTDSIPDVVVTRWPVDSRLEVLRIAAKMQDYNQNGIWGAMDYRVALLANNTISRDDDNGVLIEIAADSAQTRIPLSTELEMLWATDYPEYCDPGAIPYGRSTAVMTLLSSFKPELTLMLASGSWRYSPCGFFPKESQEQPCPVRVEDLGVGHPLVVWGGSCQSACWSWTENVAIGEPVCEDYLFRGDWTEGAVAWIGPSLGTVSRGNGRLLTEFLETTFDNVSRPIAESFRSAVAEVASAHSSSGDDWGKNTALSYVFLGDPLSRLNHPNISPTSIATLTTLEPDDVVVRMDPNPFAESVEVSFFSPRKGRVTLDIFDVRGRRVKRVLNGVLPRGWHSKRWAGANEDEVRVSAGVYFYRASIAGNVRVGKMTVLR